MAKTITGLSASADADLVDAAVLAVDDDSGDTRKATLAQLRTALGVAISKAGTLVGTRGKVNLIEGANVSLAVEDDPTNARVNVTVAVPLRAARAYLSADQSIPGSTWTTLSLAGESHDTDTLHDTGTNPSRIKLDKIGIWELTGQVTWQNTSYDGYRGARLLLTGATVLAQAEQYGAASTTPHYSIPVIRSLKTTVDTGYVELQGIHYNASAISALSGAEFTYLEATYRGAA